MGEKGMSESDAQILGKSVKVYYRQG